MMFASNLPQTTTAELGGKGLNSRSLGDLSHLAGAPHDLARHGDTDFPHDFKQER
jgi:hypothetical protein